MLINDYIDVQGSVSGLSKTGFKLAVNRTSVHVLLQTGEKKKGGATGEKKRGYYFNNKSPHKGLIFFVFLINIVN